MWMFTPYGFYSVVQSKNRPSRVVVRSRARWHLTVLQRQFPTIGLIQTTPTADYRFRIEMSKHQWATIAQVLSEEINYTNFKDAAKELGWKGVDESLLDIWSIMWNFQVRLYGREYQESAQRPHEHDHAGLRKGHRRRRKGAAKNHRAVAR